MPRITVNVSAEAETWLEEEAEALGVSKARVGGHCIEVMQNSVQHIDLQRSAVTGDEGDIAPDIRDRLAALEERVDELETEAVAGEVAADISREREAKRDAGESAPATRTREQTREAGGTESDAFHTADEKSHSVPSDAETSGEGFMPPVAGLEFEKQATDKRLLVVEEWLEHVRADGRVQKSDFEAWYTDDHADRTGYEPGGFWDFFAKPALRQVEGFEQPNSRTYVWVGTDA